MFMYLGLIFASVMLLFLIGGLITFKILIQNKKLELIFNKIFVVVFIIGGLTLILFSGTSKNVDIEAVQLKIPEKTITQPEIDKINETEGDVKKIKTMKKQADDDQKKALEEFEKFLNN